jgi:hypothetical protein
MGASDHFLAAIAGWSLDMSQALGTMRREYKHTNIERQWDGESEMYSPFWIMEEYQNWRKEGNTWNINTRNIFILFYSSILITLGHSAKILKKWLKHKDVNEIFIADLSLEKIVGECMDPRWVCTTSVQVAWCRLSQYNCTVTSY